jgi:L-malate glycosyltransferase
MKILLLCHEYPPLGGGGGVGAQQYAESWASKGHEVTVLTSRAHGAKPEENLNGVHMIRVLTFGIKNRATVSFLGMFSYLIFAMGYILGHVRDFGSIDVINSHFSIPNGVLGLVVSKLFNVPHVLTIIGGDIYEPTKESSPHRFLATRLLNRFIMNSVDRLVAISSDTKEKAYYFYEVAKDIQVINYGFVPVILEQNGRRRSAHDDDRFLLVAVGRLVKRKGFAYLIQSLNYLPSDIHLVIIGDGPLEEELKSLTLHYSLQKRVTFEGYKPRQEIYRYLENADCFVLSSLHEGLGIVVQEAMYAGLPIVATNNGGQIDLIHVPQNGLLIPPGDAKALAAAISIFYSNRQFCEIVGKTNQEDIQSHYIATNAEEYISLFRQTVNSRRSKGQKSFVPPYHVQP